MARIERSAGLAVPRLVQLPSSACAPKAGIPWAAGTDHPCAAPPFRRSGSGTARPFGRCAAAVSITSWVSKSLVIGSSLHCEARDHPESASTRSLASRVAVVRVFGRCELTEHRRAWLIWFRLCRLAVMAQAAVSDGQLLDLLPGLEDGVAATEVDIAGVRCRGSRGSGGCCSGRLRQAKKMVCSVSDTGRFHQSATRVARRLAPFYTTQDV